MEDEIWAIINAGDEEDIIGYTVRHLFAEGIDKVVVNCICSKDKTFDILAKIRKENPNLILFEDTDVVAFNGAKTTKLALWAMEYGAGRILPCDSDELWVSTDPRRSLSEAIRASHHPVLSCRIFNHCRTGMDVSSDNPYKSMVWKRIAPLTLFKVIVRFNPDFVIDEGNHQICHSAGGVVASVLTESIAVRHFPYRSAEQFVHKIERAAKSVAAADLQGCPPYWHGHGRVYIEALQVNGPQALIDHFNTWFYFEDPEHPREPLALDPAPYKGDLSR